MIKKYILTREQKEKYAERAKEKYASLSEKEKKKKKLYAKNYRQNNKEKLNEKAKKRHKQRMLDPEYRKNRREAKKLSEKRKKKNNPISFIGEHIKDSARHRNIEAPHTPLEYRKWYEQQTKVCFFCENNNETIIKYLDKVGEKITVMQNRLQIDRIDSSKGYFLNNLTLACSICNNHKSDIISAEDFKEIAKKYIAPKIKRYLKNNL